MPDKNGRPSTLEDYLCLCEEGQKEGDFFSFKNLNGNDANKTYANLVVHTQWGFTKPTEQECIDGLAQMQLDFDNRKIKREADKASGNQKLKDLGLTDDEITAIKGIS